MGMQIIREAVCKHRGGFEDASDAEIMRIWQRLDRKTQDQYLEDLQKDKKQKGDKHAAGVGTE